MTLQPGAIPRADLLPVQAQATIAFRIVRAVLKPLLELALAYRVEGRQNIPLSGPYIIIANHLNWPDPFTLLTVFPSEPRIHFLANPRNLVDHRVHFFVIRQVGGYIPVDVDHHQGPQLFRHVRLCLERGGLLGIFPEADYGPTEGRLQERWKSGFAHFAVDAQVAVLPVAISGTKDLWLRKPIRVIIGEPISPQGLTPDALRDLGRERLQALLPVYLEPAGRQLLRKWLTHLLY